MTSKSLEEHTERFGKYDVDDISKIQSGIEDINIKLEIFIHHDLYSILYLGYVFIFHFTSWPMLYFGYDLYSI